MKKAILTFGLFSLMMVLTSFTAPQEIGGSSTPKSGGTQPGTPGTGSGTGIMTEIGGNSTPKTGATITDIGGNSTPKTGVNTNTNTGRDIGGNSTPKTGATIA